MTNLPIQLASTCSGYQHISLLTRQEKVLKVLNLKASTANDKPEDFYNFILSQINLYIDSRLKSKQCDNTEEKESLIKLNKVVLSRSMVKKAVMTYSYNASFPTMCSYIKQSLYNHYIQLGYSEREKTELVYSVSEK